MRLDRRFWMLTLLSCGLVVACATVGLKSGLLHTQLKFDHAAHTEQGACGDCHEGIAKSEGPTRGAFIPKGHKVCANCHEDETKDKAKCKMCHIGSNEKVALPRRDRGLTFSHKAHLERFKKAFGKKDPGCKHCHAEAFKAKKAGTKMLGKMAMCTDSCHKGELTAQNCDKCHRNLQRQPMQAVAQLGHQGDFIKRHGIFARNTERCAQCHDQTHCANCHAKTATMPLSIKYPERVNARFVHQGNFLARHSAEARAQPVLCKKCHGNEHCASCHQVQGLQRPVAGASNSDKVRQAHGPSWMVAGTPGFHGRAARRDAARCASCHDQGQASNCIRCHKVGAFGGNPHPPGFRWQDKATACQSNSMCLSCHTNGSGCR